ncbi:nuclear transport factor 2 family protein [Kribbella catacumbae]|uniref:nuclear transport factor 2 family protein n=1 Tax=Kribbella catacumbae TaxID=460086 RepID=UPI00037D9723|nr:nuclear transport factor 2 family protein [Kribbella catacumbae]
MSRTTRLFTAVALTAGLALAAVPASAHKVSSGTSMSEQDQSRRMPRIVHQWADAWNTANPTAMSKLFDQRGVYTDHAFQASFTGPAGAKQWVELTKASISPVKITVHDTISAGDRIAVTWTFSGTFTERVPFTPPYKATGKSFSVPATSVFTVRRGRIQSVDDYYNLADILRQVDLPAGPFTPPSKG